MIREWFEWIGTAIIFISIGIIMAGLADRAVPFKLLEIDRPAAPPGGKVAFDAKVWRGITRDCDVMMYRSVFHSGGRRLDLDPQYFSAAFIREMERKTPGRMRPEIEVPDNATPGEAYVLSTLRYTCNKYQVLLPIDVHTVMYFDVLPK